ncbi:MAG TPA: hypothetical protein VHL34_17125 [Rhizomicrobium sp.]|jgi:hypothetical protein|nr:hypothetical protein [Rhizomicrobium sp.]
MQKLPIGKTVAAAYTFTLSNLGAIIGLIWIPMLIVTVLGFFANMTLTNAHIAALDTKSAATLVPGFLWIVVFYLMAFLANAMMLVAVLQLALGKRSGQVFAHFSLGPQEWRLFGANMLLVLIVIGFTTAVSVIAAAAMNALGGTAMPAPQQAGMALALLVVLIVAFVIFARLAFFVPAVTLVEEKIDLGRGWALLGGNMLRLIVVIILLTVPILILYVGMEVAVLGPKAALGAMADAGGTQTPTIDDLRAQQKIAPVVQALGFFIAPFVVGLNAGAVAFAYRTLTTVAPLSVPEPEAQ